MENWKAVVGYDGAYEVSDQGNVRRFVNLKGVLSDKYGTGYRRIYLRRNGSARCVPIHRLVLEAFVGLIGEGMEGNHKNGIKEDNRLENLEIVTPSQNQIHRARVLGKGIVKGSKHGRSKLNEEQVLEIRRLGAAGTLGKELSKQFGIGVQMISHILTRRNWKHI